MPRGGHNFIDLSDQVFGELTVLSYNPGTKYNQSTWTCKCTCSKNINVPGHALRQGNYKSCGCKRIAKRDEGARQHIEHDQVEGTRISALQAKIHVGNKSGVKGVRFNPQRGKWTAHIGFLKKQINLGYFDEKEDAVKARKEAEEKYYNPILEDKQNDDK